MGRQLVQVPAPPGGQGPAQRSQQQGEILALLLGDPDLELSLTQIAAWTGAAPAVIPP